MSDPIPNAVVGSVPIRFGPPPVRRDHDRRVTAAGLALAAVLLASAAVTAVLAAAGIGSPWAALHLALAGAGGTAVAAVLPFFAAALAQAAPARAGVRAGAIGAISGGALAVAAGGVSGANPIAWAGGLLYIVGMVLVFGLTIGALRSRMGGRIGLVSAAYGAAIAEVITGVALATAFFGGLTPVVSHWATVKPAHAWLNVFGFLSVVIAVTLLHLGPTIAGGRIRPRRSARIAIPALVAAPLMVAIGFLSGWAAIARVGAVVEIGGALALLAHGIVVQRDRGHWKSDLAWHRLTNGSLIAGIVWFAVAVGLAAGRVLLSGADPSAWSMSPLVAPLVLGWVLQVLIGAWSHLLPAVGPGDQGVHAVQRQRLGRWADARLVVWNVGVAVLGVGLGLSIAPLETLGALAVSAALVVALGLFAWAGVAGIGGGRPAPPRTSSGATSIG